MSFSNFAVEPGSASHSRVSTGRQPTAFAVGNFAAADEIIFQIVSMPGAGSQRNLPTDDEFHSTPLASTVPTGILVAAEGGREARRGELRPQLLFERECEHGACARSAETSRVCRAHSGWSGGSGALCGG